MTRRCKLQLQFQPICIRLLTAWPSSEAVRLLRGMSSTLCSPAVEHRVADGGGPRGGSVSPRERGWRAPRHAYAVFVYGVPPSNFPAPAEICAFDGETSIAGWRTRPQLTAATCTKLSAQRNCAPMGAHSQGIAGVTKPLWSWMAARCRRWEDPVLVLCIGREQWNRRAVRGGTEMHAQFPLCTKRPASSAAFFRASDLSTVSIHSASGLLSQTMPPPAWM